MKQRLKQQKKQTLVITPLLQSQIKLLNLSGLNIREKLNEIILEFCEEEKSKDFILFKDIVLEDKYRGTLGLSDSISKDLIQNEDDDIRVKLLDQLYLLSLEEYEISIGEYLIDSVDENGRLDTSLDYQDLISYILESYNLIISIEDIDGILKQIQNLEPVGCCYRNILESLNVQTEHLEINENEKSDIKKILREISEDKLKIANLDPKVINILKKLKFNPNSQRNISEISYIRPDLVVKEISDNLEVLLNDSFIIESLSEKVKNNIKQSGSIKKEESLSFINGLERRQNTLLIVGKYIISKQSRFLLHSEELKPLSLKDISQTTGVSESTISRIVKSKYLEFKQKNIPISSLLEKKVNLRSSDTKSTSPSQLEKLIGEIIENENKSKPLSDSKIKKYLEEEYKVTVARRTVSKYRKKAQILSARQRV